MKGPFEEFVRSDVVNDYLQTIGPPVKQKEMQEGMIYEVLVVSGYEEERGNWGTVYKADFRGILRFGKKSYFVRGSPPSMLLTPNFFYGKNSWGGEVEYRLGLRKGAEKVSIFPVILSKSKSEFQEDINLIKLEDLCIIHTGIEIDLKRAVQLGSEEVKDLTFFQQFIMTFWNIDDYLRKQNPEYASDFELDGWEAVEVFSGRIVNQMLRRITETATEEPNWMITQAEEFYWQGIIEWIEQCLEQKTQISENQILNFIKNLCSYMIEFRNYAPLYVLWQKKINIVPFLKGNLKRIGVKYKDYKSLIYRNREEEDHEEESQRDREDEFPFQDNMSNENNQIMKESCIVLRKISELEREIQLISRINHSLSEDQLREFTEELRKFMLDLNSFQGLEQLLQKETYIASSICSRYKPAYEDQAWIKRYAKLIEEYGQVLVNYIRKVLKAPNQSGARQIKPLIRELLLIMDDIDYYTNTKFGDLLKKLAKDGLNIIPYLKEFWETDLKEIVIITFAKAVEFTPQFIDQEGMDKVSDLILTQETEMCLRAINNYAIAIQKLPKYITQTGINRLRDLFADPNEKECIRSAALSAYQNTFETVPQFINQADINILHSLFSAADELESVRTAALAAYHKAMEVAPDFITQEGVNSISELLFERSDSLRLEGIQFFESVKKLSNRIIVQRIIEPLGTDKSNYDEEVATVKFLTSIIYNNPEFIDESVIDKIFELMKQHFSHKCAVEKSTLKSYRTILKERAYFKDHIFSLILKEISSQDDREIINGLQAFLVFFERAHNYAFYINTDILKMISNIFSCINSDAQWAALQTYRFCLDLQPNLINQETIGNISKLFTNERKNILLNAIHIYLHYLSKYPELISEVIVYKTSIISNAIQLDPKIAASWNNLGDISHRKKKYAEAELCYKKAIELDPEDTRLWNNLGIMYFDQKKYPEADQCYKKGIELNPKMAALWNNIGIISYRQKEYTEAERCYKKAIDLNQNLATAWKNLGVVYEAQNKYMDAERCRAKAGISGPEFAWRNDKGILKEYKGILEDLEKLIGKPIPFVVTIEWNTRGVKFEGNAIIGLGLFNCGLKTLPESFGQLRSLKFLTLCDNQLTTLPESFDQLQSLQELNLGGNKLRTLPKAFGQLKSLQILNLHTNQLTTLPESFDQLQSLQKLNLLGNKLRTLPETFGQLKSLQILNLSWNQLTTLPESFSQLTNLQTLNIQNNQLSTKSRTILSQLRENAKDVKIKTKEVSSIYPGLQ